MRYTFDLVCNLLDQHKSIFEQIPSKQFSNFRCHWLSVIYCTYIKLVWFCFLLWWIMLFCRGKGHNLERINTKLFQLNPCFTCDKNNTDLIRLLSLVPYKPMLQFVAFLFKLNESLVSYVVNQHEKKTVATFLANKKRNWFCCTFVMCQKKLHK
jgi:hypothetical protein